ncbi:MAG: hypothetical protein ACKVH8_14370 [Pirellulales bacterium]
MNIFRHEKFAIFIYTYIISYEFDLGKREVATLAKDQDFFLNPTF